MKRLIALIAVVAGLVLVGSAFANVLIHKNGFSSKKDFTRIDRLQGGGNCKSSRSGKALQLKVTSGSRECLFQTPVEGDRKRPDHTIQAAEKVLKKNTDKKVREKIYVGLAVRASRSSAYEVRVFPKGGSYVLLKSGAELDSGTSEAIEGLDKRNQIRLEVTGSTVVATVNGERLARFVDEAPEEVTGRKAAISFGSVAKSNKDGFGVVDSVKVFVPTP